MPISLPQAQINFFDEHHYLELEGYLNKAEITELRAAIEKHIDASNFDSAYKTGRDLWRQDMAIKKITLSHELAHLFSELTQTRPLQIGFDQVLLASSASQLSFTKQPTLLKDMCSLGPSVGGVLINLSKESFETTLSLPQSPGNLLFFNQDFAIPFPFPVSNQLFFLIAYCGLKPLYIACEADPHLHQLKAMGYSMGDHLTIKTHPLLIK